MSLWKIAGGVVVYLDGSPIGMIKPPANCYGLEDGDLVSVRGKLYFFRGLAPSVVNPPPAPRVMVAVLRPVNGVKFWGCGCGENCNNRTVFHQTETYHADPLDCELVLPREFRA